MLKIVNNLKPFFEDCYRRINVREYARIRSISPPTASKLLETFNKEGILKKEIDKNYIYYHTNKESELFIDTSRIYWRYVLENSGIIDFIEKEMLNPVVFLFGSLSKAEAKQDSDIDLAVFTATKKKINLGEFEKKLKRNIQIFVFEDIESVENRELLKNILNGYKIKGNL